MSNPTELPDLDRLEALARAATPGEWTARPHGRVVGGPMRHYVNGSAQAQIAAFSVTFHEQAPDDEPERQQANTEFCAAANPAAVLALIALARRAQPEGEAPQAERVAIELVGVREQIAEGAGFWHACSGCHDTEDGHPTGPYSYSNTMSCALGSGCSECGGIGAIWDNNDYEAMAKDLDAEDEVRAATLSPLCGAQHAESGAQAAILTGEQLYTMVTSRFKSGSFPWSMVADSGKAAWNAAAADLTFAPDTIGAALAAQSQGAQGVLCLPDAAHRTLAAKAEAPVTGDRALLAALAEAADVFMKGGVAPLRPLIDRAKAVTAQQAAAPGALDSDELTRLRRLIHALGMDGSTNASDDQVRGLLFTALGRAADKLEQAAPSAPGTPEAPVPTYMTDEQAERWSWEQVKLDVGTEGWTAGDSCTYFGFFLWGWRYRAQYQRQRAAQLDGDQEGSESNG